MTMSVTDAVQPLPGKFTAWTELLAAVENNDGVYQVSMETLRQLEGAQRVGPGVQLAIQTRLTKYGFGHLPETLPPRGTDRVILYRRGTPASDVIEAIRTGMSSAGDSTYTALKNLNATPAPSEVVELDEVRKVGARAASITLELLELAAATGQGAEAKEALSKLLPDLEAQTVQ